MKKNLLSKYRSFPQINLSHRDWPNKKIESAPIWCSVDLRDGNQALVNPMNYRQKILFFKLLCNLGFKEIEIGSPSASETEYQFARGLIDNSLIPEDVFPQVLVQARSNLIARTFEALDGYKQAIVHLYNSTSEQQRRLVFKKDKKGIIEIAVEGILSVLEHAKRSKIAIKIEYSPESFTGTELDFALEICNEVSQLVKPSIENKLILNLPATVELSTPNIYADQIEWFIKNLPKRDCHTISLHTHNDRGTGVAATELGLLAGADRVEGTLFGNGERTGNLDIITVALNLFTQGIDPKLNLENLNEIKDIYMQSTGMDVHQRHPYAGELVSTAFSGSHQDAIKKGIDTSERANSNLWDVPYLTIDPADIGRQYEPIIRINSQSGKGGVAFILQSEYGIELPKAMHPEFGSLIQNISDKLGTEIPNDLIYQTLEKEYLDNNTPFKYVKFTYSSLSEEPAEEVTIKLSVEKNSTIEKIEAIGNGPIDACKNALLKLGINNFDITHYSEHALTTGSSSKAIAYIEVSQGNSKAFGVGIDPSITTASVRALLSACNRIIKLQQG